MTRTMFQYYDMMQLNVCLFAVAVMKVGPRRTISQQTPPHLVTTSYHFTGLLLQPLQLGMVMCQLRQHK